MGDLSPHFSRSEFRCRCGCGGDTVDAGTLAVLEAVREHFGRPVTVNSGFRCASHNKAVGGSPTTQHTTGRAADIVVKGIAPTAVANWLEAGPLKGRGGLGRYPTFTHVDTRTKGPSRWQG